MKRVAVVVTHLGANSSSLCYMLDKTKRFQWVQLGIIYNHPTVVEKEIISIEHKFNNYIGMYVNEAFYNYQISHKEVHQACEFVYLVREPKCLGVLLEERNAEMIVNYYIFRLRRIYEMMKQYKGTFLTWQDLMNQKGVKILKDKFDISDDISFEEISYNQKLHTLPAHLLKKAEQAYELCLYRKSTLTL